MYACRTAPRAVAVCLFVQVQHVGLDAENPHSRAVTCSCLRMYTHLLSHISNTTNTLEKQANSDAQSFHYLPTAMEMTHCTIRKLP